MPSILSLAIPLLASLLALAPSAHPRTRPGARATDDQPTISISGAVLKTLNENPAVVALKQQVKEQKGRVRSFRGEFDWTAFAQVRADSDRFPVSRQTQIIEGTSLDSVRIQERDFVAGVTRKDRNGVIFETSVRINDAPNDTPAPFNIARSEVGVSVIIPVGRGEGADVQTANVRASRKALEATELQVLHDISERVLLTVIAYYDCLAAQQSLTLNEDIFARADQLLADARRMIRAGILEPAFIHQAEAKLAANRSDLIGGRNQLYAARQRLGVAMGLGPADLPDAPGVVGSFPEVADSALLAGISRATYLEQAKERRMDYRARLKATTSEEIRLLKDIDDTRSRFDLQLRGTYTGIGEDVTTIQRITDPFNRVNGANGGVFLTVEIPLQNNVARGRVDTRRASIRRIETGAQALLNEISAASLTEAEALRNAALRYELAKEAEEQYLKAVDFERGKYQSGNSRLNLVIELEDRYIRARLAVVEAIRRYATTLARLKFATGSLLEQKGDEVVFSSVDLHRVGG